MPPVTKRPQVSASSGIVNFGGLELIVLASLHLPQDCRCLRPSVKRKQF
jgi:hypothetical protein